MINGWDKSLVELKNTSYFENYFSLKSCLLWENVQNMVEPGRQVTYENIVYCRNGELCIQDKKGENSDTRLEYLLLIES
jgi:hypothetical protein